MIFKVRKPMQRLLRISQVAESESFFGYLLRLSEINYYGGINWLVHLSGLNTTACNNLSKRLVFDSGMDLSALAGLTGTPPETLDALRYPYVQAGKAVRFLGQPISIQALRVLQPKICPACLSESNHVRKVWDLAMMTCCPIHGCLLVDHCPGCGKRISWHRPGVSKCKCEFDFRTIEPVPASEAGTYIAELVHRMVGDDQAPLSLSTPLEDLELDDLLTVVSFFASSFDYQRADTCGNAFGTGIEQLHRALTDAANLFSDWPENFIHFLATADFNPAKNAKFGLYHRFGKFYPGLQKLFQNQKLAFIQSAFELYQLKYYSGGYVRHRNLKAADSYYEHEHVSKHDAARRLQTSEPWVERLLEAGKLEGVKVQSGKRHLILITKSSIERLVSRHANLVSITQMKKFLRIKRKTIIALVNHDLLACERGPSIDGFPHWQFSIDGLQQLFSKMEGHIAGHKEESEHSDLMNFSDTRQLLSSFQLRTLEFFDLVVSGQIKPIQRTDTSHIDGFCFSKRDVMQYIHNRNDKLRKEGYTMEQFKELIDVSLDAAYDLEKTGLISASPGRGPKVGKIISKEAAEMFHRTYITSTRIAKECGVNAATVHKFLSRAGKHPVSGPTVDGGPRYLYLRRDLADFDLSTIVESRRAKPKGDPRQMRLFDEAA